MPRTTVDIDATVLRQLKRRQRRDHKTLGELISELLARSLADERPEPEPLRWTSRRMGARVDLEDKDAVWTVLDGR